uniref:Uncharacterized protein n=1 Tax=Acrobeloides nanus TaxID=290746 RepID=A0A914CK76_9BILA
MRPILVILVLLSIIFCLAYAVEEHKGNANKKLHSSSSSYSANASEEKVKHVRNKRYERRMGDGNDIEQYQD